MNAAACFRPYSALLPQPRESRWFASCFQTNVSKSRFLQLTFGPETKAFKAVTVLHNQAPLSAGGDVGCGSAEAAPLFAFPNKSIAFDSTLSAAGQLLMSRFSGRIVRMLVGLSAVSCINRLKCIRSHLGKYWWASDAFALLLAWTAACLSQLYLSQFGSFPSQFGHFLSVFVKCTTAFFCFVLLHRARRGFTYRRSCSKLVGRKKWNNRMQCAWLIHCLLSCYLLPKANTSASQDGDQIPD